MSAGFEIPDAEELAAILQGLVTEIGELDEEPADLVGECALLVRECMHEDGRTESFDRAGVRPHNAGFVFRFGGAEYQITVVRSR